MSKIIFQRLATADADIDVSSRTIPFVFATPDIALDGNRILPGAWESRGHDGLADYRNNPIFLWSHNTNLPPIGKVTGIGERNGVLTGSVEFADTEEADKIFRLYMGKFLRAASVSWMGVDWSYAAGGNRSPGAIDFKRVHLLEISAVTVPADPNALAMVRALGLPEAPIVKRSIIKQRGSTVPENAADWKCGASRTLPVDTSQSWNAESAANSIFAACGFDSGKPDHSKARKAFLAYDGSSPNLRSSYSLPIAQMVDGRMMLSRRGLSKALDGLDAFPEAVQISAREIIKHYDAKLTERAPSIEISKRGLYEVSQLCYMLAQVGWIKKCVDAEEVEENDIDSTGPENLMLVLQALGKTLTEMAEEEVGELIASFGSLQSDVDDPDDDGSIERGLDAQRRRLGKQLARAGRKISARDTDALEEVHDHARRTRRLCRAVADDYESADLTDPETREAMFDHMNAACDHAEQTRAMMRSYIDARKPAASADNTPVATGDAAAEERALRERRAKARKHHATAIGSSAAA